MTNPPPVGFSFGGILIHDMYTWKTIPSSDYSIRSFNTYKSWSILSGSSVLLLSASDDVYNDVNTIEFDNGFLTNPTTLHSQIKTSFYSITDTPTVQGIRSLKDRAKVFSIPNEYIGDGIKPGSVTITDLDNDAICYDNTSGSLISGSNETVVGDIFYGSGVAVYTHTASIDNIFNGDWKVQFKSTQTITEHEIFISVDKTEFNVSRNPTALDIRNQSWYLLPKSSNLIGSDEQVMIDAGTQYIRKLHQLPNGDTLDLRYGSKVVLGVSGGFEHYKVSASVDTTGSFLTPFVTTIGMYDTDNVLVAVAKLPRPIKMEPRLPINFIVRFDV